MHRRGRRVWRAEAAAAGDRPAPRRMAATTTAKPEVGRSDQPGRRRSRHGECDRAERGLGHRPGADRDPDQPRREPAPAPRGPVRCRRVGAPWPSRPRPAARRRRSRGRSVPPRTRREKGRQRRGDGEVGEQRVDPGHQRCPERVAPEHDVEGEGPARLGEEPLGARLAAEAASEHVGRKSDGERDRGMPWRSKRGVPTASGPYSNRVEKMSSAPMSVTAPPPKSPTSAGRAKVANCATGCATSSPVEGRTKIRPSNPPGSSASIP